MIVSSCYFVFKKVSKKINRKEFIKLINTFFLKLPVCSSKDHFQVDVVIVG